MTCVADRRVRVEELLDLARVDVLAAADDHVLDAPDDVHVALVVHRREVARVHPARRVDRLRGRSRIVPVAEHHAVAARAELARRAARHDRAGLRVDDLHLDVRVHAADRARALVERVVDRGLRRDGRGLGHAVADGHLAHVHRD
jgi:hypothetical protein